MAPIHPTAIVAESAQLGQGVEIGPYCTVGPDVALGDGVRLISHVVLDGRAEIGANSIVYPFACIGQDAQDVKSRGGDGKVTIGANTIIREHSTLHRGTPGGGGVTQVGNNCYLMVNSHVAHDCVVGNHVILSNNAVMGGHVTIGDFAILGGNSAIHQFVRIGPHAMIGGLSGAELDVIPYGLVYGNRDGLSGLNLIGLRRRGFGRNEISDLRKAYRLLFADEGTLTERVADVTEMFAESPQVMEIIDFINTDSSRPIGVPRQRRAA